MTPFTHTTTDSHITVYQAEIRTAIHQAKAHPGAPHALRSHIARGLVRAGAWLLPDKSEVIGGTVFILAEVPSDSAGCRAA